MASIKKRANGQWRARYRDDGGKGARAALRPQGRRAGVARRADGQARHRHARRPKQARTTVGEWCDTWLEGYRGNGPRPCVRPRSTSPGSWPRSGPCGSARSGRRTCGRGARSSRRRASPTPTSTRCTHGCRRSTPTRCTTGSCQVAVLAADLAKAGKQRAYVATTEQVWALHDAMPEHLRAAVLLGAFAGLRLAEACGLRVADVDFMRGVVSPAVQYPAEPLKSETSRTPVPIPQSLALELSAHVARWRRRDGARQRARAPARAVDPRARNADGSAKVPGLPPDFRYHDLRHYFARLLIASGADVKVVQARMRHASAKTTLDTYGHLWPDSDDSTRAAIEAVMAAREDNLRIAKGGGA